MYMYGEEMECNSKQSYKMLTISYDTDRLLQTIRIIRDGLGYPWVPSASIILITSHMNTE